MVRPVTIIGDAEPVTDIPPGFVVTVYERIVEPPLFIGGVNIIVTCVFPAKAITPVGGLGTVVLDPPPLPPLPTPLYTPCFQRRPGSAIEPIFELGAGPPAADIHLIRRAFSEPDLSVFLFIGPFLFLRQHKSFGP